jgi:hypothetical protein
VVFADAAVPDEATGVDRQGVSLNDLIDFTLPKAEAVEFASKYKIGPIFTPPVVSKCKRAARNVDPAAATGGANWARLVRSETRTAMSSRDGGGAPA